MKAGADTGRRRPGVYRANAACRSRPGGTRQVWKSRRSRRSFRRRSERADVRNDSPRTSDRIARCWRAGADPQARDEEGERLCTVRPEHRIPFSRPGAAGPESTRRCGMTTEMRLCTWRGKLFRGCPFDDRSAARRRSRRELRDSGTRLCTWRRRHSTPVARRPGEQRILQAGPTRRHESGETPLIGDYGADPIGHAAGRRSRPAGTDSKGTPADWAAAKNIDSAVVEVAGAGRGGRARSRYGRRPHLRKSDLFERFGAKVNQRSSVLRRLQGPIDVAVSDCDPNDGGFRVSVCASHLPPGRSARSQRRAATIMGRQPPATDFNSSRRRRCGRG